MKSAIKLMLFTLTISNFFSLSSIIAQPDASWPKEQKEKFNDYMKDVNNEARERKERYDREKADRDTAPKVPKQETSAPAPQPASCANESQQSKSARQTIVNSKPAAGLTITSGCRENSQAHLNKGGVDFRTNGAMTEHEAIQKAKEISKETQDFCQVERVNADGSQDNFRFYNGERLPDQHLEPAKASANHIHCQKSTKTSKGNSEHCVLPQDKNKYQTLPDLDN